MKKADLKGMSKRELEEFSSSLGIEKFRGRQLHRWMYQDGIADFDLMSDISRRLKDKIREHAFISEIVREKEFHSIDSSTRFLFRLADGLLIESVLIPEERRVTLCVSSQVGCPAKCAFCATGQLGFKRNLGAGEIVDQFLQAQKRSGRRISNIVFMGMGEPLLNLENVLKACQILTDDHGPAFSKKKITVSTAGIVKGMRRFSESANKLGLAVSLHSADEEVRRKIIPLARGNSLPDIMVEAKHYTWVTRRRVSFEYLLLGGMNDSISDANMLVKLIHGIPCKINLIPFNPVKGLPFRKPSEESVLKFRDYLYPRTYAVNIRESRGLDVQGACGQLVGSASG
jgi:23S rRNA (adenine2503-C2)-methyltransferase